MSAAWFGAKARHLPDATVLPARLSEFLDEVEHLSGRSWSVAELEQLADELRTLSKAVRVRDHAVAVQREARSCGCELAAPLLPSGEFDLAKTYVVHGPDCRLTKGQ